MSFVKMRTPTGVLTARNRSDQGRPFRTRFVGYVARDLFPTAGSQNVPPHVLRGVDEPAFGQVSRVSFYARSDTRY